MTPTAAATATRSASPFLSRMAQGSAIALIIYVGAAGVSYAAQLVLARIIGADGYGVYAYVFAWAAILGYVSALGFDVSLLRFVPAYRSLGAWSLMHGVIRFAERRVALVGIGVALAGALTITAWPGEMASEMAQTYIRGFALVPILALLWVRSSIVRAYGGVVSALVPDRMVRDGLLLVLVGVAGFGLRWHVDAPMAMNAMLFSSLVGLGLVSLAARRLRPANPAFTEATGIAGATAEERRTWLRVGAALLVMGAAEALMNRMGVMLLGWAGAIKDAGIYAVAFNVAFLVVLPRTAVNALFAPAIAEMFARKDMDGLQALVARTAVWTLLGAAAIALPLFVVAGPVLALFGHDFAGGASAVRILLVGQMLAAISGSQSHMLTMTGHERSAAVLLVVSTLGNAALGVLLIRVAGRDGAAIASAVTLVLWNVAMTAFVWRRLRLVPGLLAILQSSPKRLPSLGR